MTTRSRTWLALLGALGSCGDDSSPAASREPTVASARDDAAGTDDDPLLRRAREGLRDGEIAPAERAQLLASDEPAHARARRLLHAIDDPTALEPAGGDGEAALDDGPDRIAPLVAPEPGTEPASEDGPPPPRATEPGTEPRPRDPPRARPSGGGPADVGTLALRSSGKGATLTIAAPSSLVVGVAHQPQSGIVRLVIESARASPKVLAARPRVEGARVTAVRQGQGTIQVTLELDPGWTLGSVTPFSGGAKVHLRAPA